MSSELLRFWRCVAVAPIEECWPWKNSTFKFGHGRYWIGGKGRQAHRVAWELTYGAIPDGLCVLHKCDVPGCCNPKHLFLGTQLDNMIDRDTKQRMARGERDGRAILKERDVLDMRAASVYFTQRELSAMYGISPAAVSFAISGRTWRHVNATD